ncbi:helix-turn-helix transcriptional regulator [uncultured Clostridium sp.]|uniref:helix-turn-helix domain-containing protein n=1 Tax=uncultured Clostridium sp. TaxID=59620 RepID=UPI00261BC2D5|nr:helix-turn-helix transcriptional regulator [uncultured Clostridium sp.]
MEILSLGDKIKRRRKELNMTLKDLAKDRITPGQISLVESRRSNPSMDLLEYLAETLDVNVEYLMESEESQAENISLYYEQLAEAYIGQREFEFASENIRRAYEYAEKYNIQGRKGKILHLAGKIYLAKGQYGQAQSKILSANIIFIKHKKYEEIVRSFLDLAKITLKLKAYHSANSYLKQAERVYVDNKIIDELLIAEIYYNLAKSYFEIENIDDAVKYSNLTKDKLEKINNRKEYGKALLKISEEYGEQENIKNAIKYSKKTLDVYAEMEQYKSISNIQNRLGELFYNFENIVEAEKHFNNSKEMKERNGDKETTNILINICQNYLKIKNIKKCKNVLENIYSLLSDNDKQAKIECLLIEYRMYQIEEDLEKAEKILLEAYNFACNNEIQDKIAELSIILGKFYIDLKKTEKAEKYLDRGVGIFREIGVLKN